MSLTTVETSIWRECQLVLKNRQMRKKDLLEWATSEIEDVPDGEIAIWLPEVECYAIVPSALDRRDGA